MEYKLIIDNMSFGYNPNNLSEGARRGSLPEHFGIPPRPSFEDDPNNNISEEEEISSTQDIFRGPSSTPSIINPYNNRAEAVKIVSCECSRQINPGAAGIDSRPGMISLPPIPLFEDNPMESSGERIAPIY